MSEYGLIGEKLGHSISPKIHGMIFLETLFDGNYQLYEISRERLPGIKEFMRENNLLGINVTIPYKQEIMPFLDEISDEAKQIGAVNTVIRCSDKLIGFNTDYYGFGQMLKYNEISIVDKDVLVLGNGGAAKAVVAYLINNGARNVFIASRTPKESPYDCVKMISYNETDQLDKDYIIVNTTPVGMYPNVDACPVKDCVVQRSSAVVDLIYNPKATEIMKKAEHFSKPCCNGLYMLVGQAVKAQEIWREEKFASELTNKIYQALIRE